MHPPAVVALRIVRVAAQGESRNGDKRHAFGVVPRLEAVRLVLEVRFVQTRSGEDPFVIQVEDVVPAGGVRRVEVEERGEITSVLIEPVKGISPGEDVLRVGLNVTPQHRLVGGVR